MNIFLFYATYYFNLSYTISVLGGTNCCDSFWDYLNIIKGNMQILIILRYAQQIWNFYFLFPIYLFHINKEDCRKMEVINVVTLLWLDYIDAKCSHLICNVSKYPLPVEHQ